MFIQIALIRSWMYVLSQLAFYSLFFHSKLYRSRAQEKEGSIKQGTIYKEEAVFHR
jgi:hypothetical protein